MLKQAAPHPQSAIQPSAKGCCDLGVWKRQCLSKETSCFFLGHRCAPPDGMSLDSAVGLTATFAAANICSWHEKAAPLRGAGGSCSYCSLFGTFYMFCAAFCGRIADNQH
eukprot:s711_g12.t1